MIPNGLGVAVIRVNTETNEICYQLVAKRIEPATMAHIHVGSWRSGRRPVVQGLNAPTDGTSKGCVVNATVADALAENPSDYYVNVHNATVPGDAAAASRSPDSAESQAMLERSRARDRHSPTVPSRYSRRMSMCPRWRAVSSSRWRWAKRSVNGLPRPAPPARRGA